MRVGSALLLTTSAGFLGVSLASPLAWVGDCAVVLAAYAVWRRRNPIGEPAGRSAG